MIALPEYLLQVPANRLGYGQLTGFQLKILQEVITLCVFIVFAWFYLGEGLRWNYAVSFALILAAVWFAFRPGRVRLASLLVRRACRRSDWRTWSRGG